MNIYLRTQIVKDLIKAGIVDIPAFVNDCIEFILKLREMALKGDMSPDNLLRLTEEYDSLNPLKQLKEDVKKKEEK